MFYVYYVENQMNGKLYVGKTKPRSGNDSRWKEHLADANSGRTKMPIHRAMRKYGAENFNYNVISTFKNEADALEAEVCWIALLRGVGAELYNITDGGEGATYKHGPQSPEHFAKLKHFERGIPSMNRGKKMGEEFRAKVSAASVNKKVSDKQKEEIRNLYESGYKQAILATMYGVGKDWISRIVNNKTTSDTRAAASTGRKGKLKISEEQHQEIRELYMTKEHTLAELATRYGVNQKTISRIIKSVSGKVGY